MQAGQWEFVATPTNAPPVFVETNLVVSGTSVSATQPNVELFEPNGSTFSACTNFTISASMTNGVLAGTMTGVGSGVQTAFSGATIASGGEICFWGLVHIPKPLRTCGQSEFGNLLGQCDCSAQRDIQWNDNRQWSNSAGYDQCDSGFQFRTYGDRHFCPIRGDQHDIHFAKFKFAF